MFIRNEKRFNPYAQFTDDQGVTYANLSDPALRASLGVTEIPDPTHPEDYSDDTYFKTEQGDAPYVIYTKRPQEQIDQSENNRLIQKMDALESKSMRAVREAVLSGDQAALQVIEDKIDALRKKLKKLEVVQ